MILSGENATKCILTSARKCAITMQPQTYIFAMLNWSNGVLVKEQAQNFANRSIFFHFSKSDEAKGMLLNLTQISLKCRQARA